MSQEKTLPTSYRLAVASRVAAAALGGYALACAATVLMAQLWPATRAQALLWASMLGFAVYAIAVIWVFTTRSATRAWVGVAATTAVLAAMAWTINAGGST